MSSINLKDRNITGHQVQNTTGNQAQNTTGHQAQKETSTMTLQSKKTKAYF